LDPAVPEVAVGADFQIQTSVPDSVQRIVVDYNLAVGHYCANLVAAPVSLPWTCDSARKAQLEGALQTVEPVAVEVELM